MTGCLYTLFIEPFVIIGRILWNLLLLVPYVLLLLGLWLVINYFSWGSFSFLPTVSLPTISLPNLSLNQAAATATPVTPSTVSSPQVANTTYSIIFRFIWQGEEIYYLGNQISEEYFYELARQAKELNGKVEVQASGVSTETYNRRVDTLNQIGVPYEIIPVT